MLRPGTGESAIPRIGLSLGVGGPLGEAGCVPGVVAAVLTGAVTHHRARSVWVFPAGVAGPAGVSDGFVAAVGAASPAGLGADVVTGAWRCGVGVAACLCLSC